jgi:hypothetical protein
VSEKRAFRADPSSFFYPSVGIATAFAIGAALACAVFAAARAFAIFTDVMFYKVKASSRSHSAKRKRNKESHKKPLN